MQSDRYCPCLLLKQYSEIRATYAVEKETFFIFRDKSPVKPRHVRQVLRTALHEIGLDINLYDTHSLSIGRASDLMKQGVNIEQIKFFGRWKSNAIF